MKERYIEDLVHMLKNSDADEPKPIVLLGAGASVTAGIPLAFDLTKEILENHHDNPSIKRLAEEKRSYANVMACLNPIERKKVLLKYVQSAKINVTHIYLAHLMNSGYIDYILTVNFDNLVQKALALYNQFPPTFDISVIKEVTTTSLQKNSIIYLHGKYDGIWQLNTLEEMKKIKTIVPSILQKVTNERSVIVVGYSGNDPIFDELIKFDRFDNGLYWVGYNEQEPSKRVKKYLLDKPNNETYFIKGFDSDSFFLTLNSELGLSHPLVFNHPFSHLKNILNNINDVEENEETLGIKTRLENAKKMVQSSIAIYQEEKPDVVLALDEIERINIQKRLINILVSENYEDLELIESSLEKKDLEKLDEIFASIYNKWGNSIIEKGNDIKISNVEAKKSAIDYYYDAINLYKKAMSFKPNLSYLWANWANSLINIARLEPSSKAHSLYLEANKKISKSIKLNSNYAYAWRQWGRSLRKLSQLKSGKEAEKYLEESVRKYEKAFELNPSDFLISNGWGSSLFQLSRFKKGEQKLYLLNKALEKFEKVIETKPDHYFAHDSIGFLLLEFEELNIPKTKTSIAVQDHLKHFKLAQQISGRFYNLSCFYALKKKKKEALTNLENALTSNQISADWVIDDKDWDFFKEDDDFKKIIEKYRTN